MYSERSVHKRSSMQDLVDGKCPDLDAEADRIQNEPAAAPSGDAAGGDTQGGSGGDTRGGSGNGNDNNGSGASDLVIHLGTWCLVGLTGFMVALM